LDYRVLRILVAHDVNELVTVRISSQFRGLKGYKQRECEKWESNILGEEVDPHEISFPEKLG